MEEEGEGVGSSIFCSFVKTSWICHDMKDFFFLSNSILNFGMETEGGGHHRDISSFRFGWVYTDKHLDESSG